MSPVSGSVFAVTIFTVIGTVLAFLSNVIIAANFGAGKDMDVYIAATTLPFFVTSVLSGSMTFTFIPIFAEYRARDPAEIWNVVSSFINLTVLVTGFICLCGAVFAHPIMSAIAPGFSEDKVAKSAELLVWLLPLIILSLVNELMASVYYSNQRFIIPSVNKVISPLITMAYVLVFHDAFSTKSIVFAMLTASSIQAVLLVVGFVRAGEFKYSLVLDYRHPGVAKILQLMIPLVLGMLVYRAVPVVDAFFLSQLSHGSISHIGYALKLTGAITPIIVTGISVSIFPVMSQYAAEKNWDALKAVASRGIRMLFYLASPFVVLLGLYGRPVVRLVFERGVFTPADTSAVYGAFAIYLLALPAGAIGGVVSQIFYAIQHNRTIAFIGVMMMGLYLGLCFLLIKPLNYLAIPVAYVIYHNCAILTTSLVIRTRISKGWPQLAPFFIKSSLSALLAALIIYPAIRLVHDNLFLSVGFCASGFVLYFIISKFVLLLEEADAIWQLFRNYYLAKFVS